MLLTGSQISYKHVGVKKGQKDDLVVDEFPRQYILISVRWFEHETLVGAFSLFHTISFYSGRR